MNHQNKIVAPFTGVWIETNIIFVCQWKRKVAPFTGVWIETATISGIRRHQCVAPFTGVWIETLMSSTCAVRRKSPPSRGCGLKHLFVSAPDDDVSRPLHGGVD